MMPRWTNYNRVAPQVIEKAMPVRIMHPIDGWTYLSNYAWAPYTRSSPGRDAREFLRSLAPFNASKETKWVLWWAALTSRESYEIIVNEPALVDVYLPQAQGELRLSLYKEIRDKN
jgi:hypothetical protein